MKTIIKSLSIILIIAVFAIGGTVAYFSDTETSIGNTFTAGTLDLKIGNDDPTTWNFTVENILPGDSGGQETIIQNTGTINGYLHISFADLLDEENNHIEPEAGTANQNQENCEEEGGVWDGISCNLTGDGSGELAENLEILIYIDENSNGAFDLGIDELVYQGKVRGILQGDIFNYSLASFESRDFRIEWGLPLEVGNVAQSDKAGFDIVFELTQNKKGIVGNWHFNEGAGNVAYDSSGYGNDGIINGATWGDGKYNPALEFDGVDDYADCGNGSSLDLTNTNDFTIELWAKKYDNLPSGNVMGLAGKNIKYAIDYYFERNKLRAGIRNSEDGQYIITADAPNNLLDWTYVAFTYESEKSEGMKLYVNSELKSFRTTIGLHDFSDTSRHFQISGAATGGNIEKFNGAINEVKVYNRALSADEILENYNKSENSGGTNATETKTIYLNQFGADINSQYGYQHDYTSAANNNVSFTYGTPQNGEKLIGTMSASGLKPYATYQVKFEGKPICANPVSGNNQANEYIGYKGRWTCVSGATCAGNANARNRNDAQYQANSHYKGNSSECIIGYLVFDYFTADASGNIEISDINISTDTSYHVLYCGGGTCNSNNNNYLYYPDSTYPGLAFCPNDKVDGEIQPGRGGCNGLSLDSGIYDLKMALTEESFHQGNWATVLTGDINFEIN